MKKILVVLFTLSLFVPKALAIYYCDTGKKPFVYVNEKSTEEKCKKYENLPHEYSECILKYKQQENIYKSGVCSDIKLDHVIIDGENCTIQYAQKNGKILSVICGKRSGIDAIYKKYNGYYKPGSLETRKLPKLEPLP